MNLLLTVHGHFLDFTKYLIEMGKTKLISLKSPYGQGKKCVKTDPDGILLL